MIQHAEPVAQRCLFCTVEQMGPGCSLELTAVGGAIYATVHAPDCLRAAHSDGCHDRQCPGCTPATVAV